MHPIEIIATIVTLYGAWELNLGITLLGVVLWIIAPKDTAE